MRALSRSPRQIHSLPKTPRSSLYLSPGRLQPFIPLYNHSFLQHRHQSVSIGEHQSNQESKRWSVKLTETSRSCIHHISADLTTSSSKALINSPILLRICSPHPLRVRRLRHVRRTCRRHPQWLHSAPDRRRDPLPLRTLYALGARSKYSHPLSPSRHLPAHRQVLRRVSPSYEDTTSNAAA